MEDPKILTAGIMGAGHGCGVTHFSILLANYIAAVELKKTAVLEWQDHDDFRKMIKICLGEKQEKKPSGILGVDYFPQSGEKELAWCMQGQYDCIVMDLGTVRDGKKAEFLQCGRKFFLGALNEWMLNDLSDELGWLEAGKEGWDFLAVFGSNEARKELKRRFGFSFGNIPYAPDSFSLEKDTALWLRRIWRKKS